MKVILKSDLDNLGKAGDLVEVKAGYARNFLIPRQVAVEATTKNVGVLEHQKRLIAGRVRKERQEMEAFAHRINETTITIPVQVGEEGKLFGSVTNKDVALALGREGIEVDKRKVRLDDPIKEVGEFTIPISLQHDITAHLKVFVVKA
jgi:large subunit ribosomal protein L9